MKIIRENHMNNAFGGRGSRRSISTETESISLPRLVVSDAVSASKVLVAKTRAEVNGLNAFLCSLAGLRTESK